MQCKGCTHQQVCMHKNEFDRLEGQLPKTAHPFKSTVTCSCYKQETDTVRGYAQEITGTLGAGRQLYAETGVEK